MIIKTDRLILRPWTEADAESLYEYARDPRIGPMAGWEPHTNVEYSRGIIRDLLSLPGNLAVELQDRAGEAVGAVGLIRENSRNEHMQPNEVEVGYWIGVPFWGNGYIPEAVEALLTLSFEYLGVDAVWCGYFDGNEKSYRAQSKCGFRYHHTAEVSVDKLGENRLEHFTRLTRAEWEERADEE